MPTLSLTQPLIKRRIRGVPNSFWAQIYLLLAVLETIVVLIIQIVNIANTAADDSVDAWSNTKTVSSGSILVYDSLFIVGQLFFVVIAWEAVAHKNTIQVIATTCFNCLLFVYALIQYFNNVNIAPADSTASNLLVLRLCLGAITGVCSIAFAALTWELFLDFGWKIFKKLGADLAVRTMFKRRQVLITLFKLDVFFFVGYAIQTATLVLKVTDAETWVQIGVVMPGSVLVLTLGFYALHWENARCMLVVMFCLAVSPAYFIYRLVRMYTVGNHGTMDPYWDTREYLLFFIIVNIVLILGTLYSCWLCYRDFGKGLKTRTLDYQNGKVKAQVDAESTDAAAFTPGHAATHLPKSENRDRWQLE
ncbi:hypothetical protein IWQ60_006576 [Tieghemiomyces parasiticus]|uniref:Uncharacterized protein n=1 Tax=Tieghemiomyces parasiticus TaxID=78921 RepID=A0A9W8DS18_9FUNG|nr:hypothetical protein IWQ60_006576 [Tieghemiomyces parasiticus]